MPSLVQGCSAKPTNCKKLKKTAVVPWPARLSFIEHAIRTTQTAYFALFVRFVAEKRERGLYEEVKTGDFRLARPEVFALVELFKLSSAPADTEDEYS